MENEKIYEKLIQMEVGIQQRFDGLENELKELRKELKDTKQQLANLTLDIAETQLGHKERVVDDLRSIDYKLRKLHLGMIRNKKEV